MDNSDDILQLMVQIVAPLLIGVIGLAIGIIRFMRFWITAAPFDLKPFDSGQIPQALREREEIFTAQLTTLGYHSIGNCQWQWNDRMTVLTSVWVRQDAVAEINVVIRRKKRQSGVSVAFGQEYMNETRIAVLNCAPNSLAMNDEAFFFPNINDAFTLDDLLQAIIAKRRRDRPSWVPASALEYKTREISMWRDKVVEAGLYRFDARRNRYWPTWKCLRSSWRGRWTDRGSFRFGQTNAPKKTADLLRELGFPTLQVLQKGRQSAFQVVEPKPAFPVVVRPDESPAPSEK